MRKRSLGCSGMNLSVVGFGAWAIGSDGQTLGWGSQDESAAISAIHRAVELGINWIDTAPAYGHGRSEILVGRACREMPVAQRPYIFTKCGLQLDEKNKGTFPKRVLTPDSIRTEVEASLTRLGVDKIDLYQIHWPPEDDNTPIEELWYEMGRLVKAGKVGAIGVSNFDVELLERCEDVRHIDSLQPPFSLIHRGSGKQLIQWCLDHEVGVIVYSPMQSGLLTDKFSVERIGKLASSDWRRLSPDFKSPRLESNLALRDGLRPIAKRHKVSVAAVAVAWTLAWPGVTGAIVGARSPEQVDGWIAASTLELSPDDLDEIAEVIQHTGVGKGPSKPPTLPTPHNGPQQ